MGRKKKQEDDTDHVSFIGRRVEKDFQGFGKFSGSVVAYNAARGFYKVVYDDGDREELELKELESILINAVDDAAPPRKRGRPPKQKEELHAPSEDVPDSKRPKRELLSKENTPGFELKDPEDSTCLTRHRFSRQRLKDCDDHADEKVAFADELKENDANGELNVKGCISFTRSPKRKRLRQDEECGSGSVTATRVSSHQVGGRSLRSSNLLQDFDDEALNSDENESSAGAGSDVDEDVESPLVDEDTLSIVDAKPPEELKLPALVPLPPSSKTFPLPDDLVVEAFAVYSFLRSFSHALFLCPFCFDDFVSAVMAKTPNHLIDSIHLILLQALRRHLQRLSKDGCEKSKECLRQRDWDLLDYVTWPSFLAVFLSTHGFGKSYGQPISLLGLLDDEYYKVSIKVKLAILSFLCDHVLETEEIRAVLDARELESTSQVREKDMKYLGGRVIDVLVTRDHKEKVADDTFQGTISLSTGPLHIESKEESSTDWNSDECVLCGMNGNLICCDGCPAAYHSRCVGISRSSLPPGDWFCPECIVDKIGGEHSRRMRGLGGCNSIGVDPYGRSFIAACGHLLVLNISDPAKLSYNYYNKKDILGVLQSLESLKPFCNEIAIAICETWDIPAKHSSVSISSHLLSGSLPVSSKGESNSEEHVRVADQHKLAWNKSEDKELDAALPEVLVSDANESPLESKPLGPQDAKEILMDSVAELLAGQPIVGSSAGDPASDLNSTLSSSCLPSGMVSKCDCKIAEQCPENMLTEPLKAALIDNCNASTSKPLERTMAVTDHCAQNSQSLEQDPYLAQNITERDSKGRFLTVLQREQLLTDQLQKAAPWEHLHTDSFQRLSSYINHYVFGDAAATAAANLALMTADQLASPDKAKRKTTTIAEQIKAFCKAPARFCWPSFRRKLMDVPKDRCGWCFSCTSNMKRGCLMNQAAIQLAAGAARVAGGVRPGKSGSGHLPAVAGYLLHMEESVHSLLGGPWGNIMFRKQWRKRLEQATSIFDVKAALLDLEANLRSVVLTEDWSKCIEDAPDMVIGGSTASVLDDSLSKKASGKKCSRRSGASRRAPPKSSSTLMGAVQWARRGRIAHRVSGWATLSSKVARKAGRQGGLKNIAGISYVDGEEVSKRNKQIVWRARVQAARTIAELAVQVRCLDSVIRWEDLVSKVEVQSVSNVSENDCKADDTKFGVHAKSVQDGVHLYLIDSILTQKQGVRQNVSAASRLQNCKNQQVWVDECKVPLFLLKDFEEKERASKQSEAPKLITLQNHYSEFKMLPKKDVFKFLWERAGFSVAPTKLVVSIKCKFCSLKVSASLAVQCHLCREPFHKECTVASHSVGKLELKYTCCGCLKLTVGHKCNDAHTLKQEPILCSGMQKNEKAQPILHLPNKPNKIVFTQSRPPLTSPAVKLSLKAPLRATTSGSAAKEELERGGTQVSGRSSVSSAKISEKSHYEGVSWRKHGRKSRMRFERNMLFPIEGSEPCHEVPKCYACKQQYQGDLIYIKCEYCPLWFHGAAVAVNQSNVRAVLSFKCHKCRKKGVPFCPYGTNHQTHKRVVEGPRVKEVCITKRTPLPLLRSDGNQQQQFVTCPVPDSNPAISLECDTSSPAVDTQLQLNSDKLQYAEGCIPVKPLVDSNVPAELDKARLQAYVQSSNACMTRRTPLPLSRASENQLQQHLASAAPDTISAGSLPVKKPCGGVEPLTIVGTQVSKVTVQPCFQGSKDDSQQSADMENGTEGDEALSKEIVVEDSSKNGENPNQQTLSFMELLSSEDDRVEEIAEVAMDFGGDGFDVFDLDTLIDSFGSCGASELSLEPEAPLAGDPCQDLDVKSESVIQGTGFNADTDDEVCAVCCDGSIISDLHCIGCGLAVHQQCVVGSLATETWTGRDWVCDACKAEALPSQG